MTRWLEEMHGAQREKHEFLPVPRLAPEQRGQPRCALASLLGGVRELSVLAPATAGLSGAWRYSGRWCARCRTRRRHKRMRDRGRQLEWRTCSLCVPAVTAQACNRGYSNTEDRSVDRMSAAERNGSAMTQDGEISSGPVPPGTGLICLMGGVLAAGACAWNTLAAPGARAALQHSYIYSNMDPMEHAAT